MRQPPCNLLERKVLSKPPLVGKAQECATAWQRLALCFVFAVQRDDLIGNGVFA